MASRRKPALKQQSLSFELIDPPATGEIPEWVTGSVVDRTGRYAYLHLIRGMGDPERGDIRKLPTELRDRGAEWLRKLLKSSAESWQEPILLLLADNVPRTFNRIGVELLDKTADVLFESPPDEALWMLVAERRVEHTISTPTLFRVVTTKS